MNIFIEKFLVLSKFAAQHHNNFFPKHHLRLKRHIYPSHLCFFSEDSTERSTVALPSTKPKDPVLIALKSASNISDALKVIGIHAPHMEAEHLAYSFRTLNTLKKNPRDSDIDVVNSEEFLFLFRRLKKHLYSLDLYDILEALKTVTFFKVPFDSSITMKLLHLIKNEVNNLSINQIIFLSFLLRQHPQSSVVDALKIALPIVFETQVKTKLDRTNLSILIDSLIYCTKNDINQDCCDYIVKSLYELDQLDWRTMDPKRAKSIVISLADIAVSSPIHDAVYADAIEIFSKNIVEYTFSEVDLTISSVIRGMKRCPNLNIPMLFEATNKIPFHKWNIVECSILLRKLNHAGYVNRNLLDNLAEKIMDDPEIFREGKFGLIKTFVAGMAIANYKTDHWNLLKDLIPAATILQNIKPQEPWVPFCLELVSIGIFSDSLISQVFSPWFLETYLSREYNKLDLLQLLRLHQSVCVLHKSYSGVKPPEEYINEAKVLNGRNFKISPLIGALEMEFGKNCVRSQCKTSLGHYIDHFVALKPGGDAEVIKNNVQNIDDLNIPEDSQRVAILFLPSSSYNSLKQLRSVAVLNLRTLEELGYAVVAISSDIWLNLPDWEKYPYIFQQINLNCSDIYHRKKDVAKENSLDN